MHQVRRTSLSRDKKNSAGVSEDSDIKNKQNALSKRDKRTLNPEAGLMSRGTVGAQLLGMILEIDERVDEVIPGHVVLLPILYGIAGDVCHEVGDVVIVEEVAEVLEERCLSDHGPDEDFEIGAEYLAAHHAEFIALLVQGVHFDAEGARADHVDGELSREIPALDDLVRRHHLGQVSLEVLGTVEQQVKHVLQLPGREDGRELRS